MRAGFVQCCRASCQPRGAFFQGRGASFQIAGASSKICAGLAMIRRRLSLIREGLSKVRPTAARTGSRSKTKSAPLWPGCCGSPRFRSKALNRGGRGARGQNCGDSPRPQRPPRLKTGHHRQADNVQRFMPIRFVDNGAGNHGENSPALQRWEPSVQTGQSPTGTEESVLSSLAGLCPHHTANPALKRWAIVITTLSTNRIDMQRFARIRYTF